MKTALVTGGSGFVGRHIIAELESRGFRTLNIDIVNGADALRFFEYATDRFDLVVHCAYTVGGRATIDGKNMALANNLKLDAGLFDWALKTKQRRVLYFSSSAAYPVMWQTEDCNQHLYEDLIGLDRRENQQPDANYGWAKLTGEKLATAATDLGLKVHIVRPFSGYGEDQGKEYPFPSFVRKAKYGPPYDVWGPPGQTRDFIYIDDVVRGALAIVDAEEYRPVNLCTGVPTELGELLGFIAREVSGNYVCINYDDTKPTGVFYRVGDPNRMLTIYTPKVSLEEGIRRALS